jgi:hypothetical protein
VALSGVFNFGTIANSSTLDILAGSTLTASNASAGVLQVSGAGAVTQVSGTLTLGGRVNVSDHARMQAGALVGDGALAVDASSTLEVGTAGTASAGGVWIDQGATLLVTSFYGGGLAVTGDVVNNGTIQVLIYEGTGSGAAGLTVNGDLLGTGIVQMGDSENLTVTGTFGAGETLDFTNAPDANANLDGASNGAVITGWQAGDVVHLAATIDTATYTQTGAGIGTLALSSHGTQISSLTVKGNYAAASFIASPGASGSGTDLTVIDGSVACFAAGTRIRTAVGDVPVEHLQAGDRVALARGGSAPVVWVGQRRVVCRRHPRPWDVWPVRVRAGAFGPGLPARDLQLSPDHAVFAGDVLIPVRYLVNGRTIVQERVAEISYFHVELPAHDVLLAEDLPCESYLDTGNRAAFANGGAAVQMHADFARGIWAADACAPLVLEGPHLTAAKARLLARAAALGNRLCDDPALRVLADGAALPAEVVGRRWRVHLPATTRVLRLASARWIPAHTRADETDGRTLGVAIGNMSFDGKAIGLNDLRLSSGWQDAEPGWRWTDGDAGLALAGVREVEFDVVLAGSYWARRGRRRLVA